MAEQYMLDIREKDAMSRLLAQITSDTLNNGHYVKPLVSGKNGVNLLDGLPAGQKVAIHSTGGDVKELDPAKYAASVIRKACAHSDAIGGQPIGFADVIDAQSTNEEFVRKVGTALRDQANNYKVPILNGELAKLGYRINCPCNISGTMITLLPEDNRLSRDVRSGFTFNRCGVEYIVLDHEGLALYINSDGIGTKTEFYERMGEPQRGVYDLMAMGLDDLVKIHAVARAISSVCETKGRIDVDAIRTELVIATREMDVQATVQHEQVAHRLKGYKENARSYNMSGSFISSLDLSKLVSLPHPDDGNLLLALAGYYPNPRSNGMTVRREIMVANYGVEWHKTPEGRHYMKFLGQPSVPLYPALKELLDKGIATAAYHPSGGAFDDKLGLVLARQGMFVEVGLPGFEELFQPDLREVSFAAYSDSVETAYSKYEMGTDGFAAIKRDRLEEARQVLGVYDLRSRNLGVIQKAQGDNIGIKFKAYNGKVIHFDGKAKAA
jgi:phosphoribosylaminoimidazole (AIR) synthetase